MRISKYFPAAVCSKIAGLKPTTLGEDDFPSWQFSSDGCFSIKSAYQCLVDNLNRPQQHGASFSRIWKLKAPPRINFFLWRVAHDRLMTNLERACCGISNSDLYPRCNQAPESVMHLLRDCEASLELWEKLVSPSVWHKFASLGHSQWLDYNLQDNTLTSMIGTGSWSLARWFTCSGSRGITWFSLALLPHPS